MTIVRARDYLGFPLLAVGLSGVLLGHHWLGAAALFIGVAVAGLGVLIVASGGFEEKIDRALRGYRGPQDYGDRHYHDGGSSSFDSSGDGGGGGND